MDNNIRKIDVKEFEKKVISCGFKKGISGTYMNDDKSECININEKSILITVYGHDKKIDESLHAVMVYLYPAECDKVLKVLGKTYIDEEVEEDGLTAYAAGIKDNTFLRVVL